MYLLQNKAMGSGGRVQMHIMKPGYSCRTGQVFHYQKQTKKLKQINKRLIFEGDVSKVDKTTIEIAVHSNLRIKQPKL